MKTALRTATFLICTAVALAAVPSAKAQIYYSAPGYSYYYSPGIYPSYSYYYTMNPYSGLQYRYSYYAPGAYYTSYYQSPMYYGNPYYNYYYSNPANIYLGPRFYYGVRRW